MIPFKDSIPRLHPPVITVGLIVVNILIHLMMSSAPEGMRLAILHFFGVVPARFLDPQWAAMAGYPDLGVFPLFSYMFLHSDWWHVIMNMWILWIFADNVEDVTGHVGFVLFYILCGLAAIGVQIAFNPDSTIPIIGASGAVAGVMGAYFLLYPHARVLTFVPLFFLPWVVPLPASLFLGLWVAIQVLSGVFGHVTGQAHNIAWWAHAGGFAAGMLLIHFFVKKGRCKFCYDRSKGDYEFHE